MITPKQSDLIHDTILLLSQKLGMNLYDFDIILSERDNIDLLDETVFDNVAGYVVRLTSLFGERDISVLHAKNNSSVITKEELDHITAYLSTLLVERLSVQHDEELKIVISLLQNTCRTWSREFKALLNLIVLFDYRREQTGYRDLIVPLADTLVRIIHKYFKEGPHEVN